MKKWLIILALLTLSVCSFSQDQKKLKGIIDDNLGFISRQYTGMVENLKDTTIQPKTIDINAKLITSGVHWWTCGFFPGSLWYIYENFRTEKWKHEAISRTAIIEKIKFNKGTHDLGFMFYCSFGNGYRLTQDPKYKDIMIQAAKSLITRFNPKIGCIKSWDGNKWQFPVIIDNMMNLELLFWATKVTGDSTYSKIAVKHADNTIKNHFRDDFSSYHVVAYDTITGKPYKKQTHQGFSDESAWARGQAWGLYGYVMCYRETGYKRYLDQASKIANFIFGHKNMPPDLVPYWDFNSPDIPNDLRDASAASINCSALIELSQFADKKNSKKYLKYAETIINSLSSDSYRAKPGENGNFVLMHGVGSKPAKSEVDVPLTYADYYFIESLMRMKKRF